MKYDMAINFTQGFVTDEEGDNYFPYRVIKYVIDRYYTHEVNCELYDIEHLDSIITLYRNFLERVGLNSLEEEVNKSLYTSGTHSNGSNEKYKTRRSMSTIGEDAIRKILRYRAVLKKYGIEDPIAYEKKN